MQYIRVSFQFFQHRSDILTDLQIVQWDDHDLISIESHFFVSHVVKLTFDKQGSDDQDERDRKLSDDKHVAQTFLLRAFFPTTLEDCYRFKRGQQQGRIAASKYPHKQYQ